MNPSNQEAPGVKLVQPSAEQALANPNVGANPRSSERPLPGSEIAPSTAASAVPATIIPLPAVPIAMPPNNVPAATASSTSQITDDDDVIEKEWVNRAKQIVERNRNDPYKQSEELTLFKADYMKKRYGKSIKVSQ